MSAGQVQTSITLYGAPPWGFRLSGGVEYNQPLVITRLTPGSLAARSGVSSGDVLVAVNGDFVGNLSQDACETKVRQASGSLHLVLEKKAAQVTEHPGGQITVDADPNVYAPKPAGTGHNRSARGFQPAPAQKPVYSPVYNPEKNPLFDPTALKNAAKFQQGSTVMQGPGKSKVVHAQYNTPMGMYSNDNIIDTVQAQAKSLGVSIPGAQDKAARPQFDVNSPVFRAVHAQQQAPSRSSQSRSFKMLQATVNPHA